MLVVMTSHIAHGERKMVYPSGRYVTGHDYHPPFSWDFPDQTDFPELTTLWNDSDYRTIPCTRQLPCDSLNRPTLIGVCVRSPKRRYVNG